MRARARARLRGRFGEGGPGRRRRKRREKGARSRVSADESLSSRIGRSGQAHPHARNMFISGFACQLRVIVRDFPLFLFLSLSRLNVDASISRKCGAAVRSVKWDFRRSLVLFGGREGGVGVGGTGRRRWTLPSGPHVIPLARKGESGEGWDRNDGWRGEQKETSGGTEKEGREESPFLR